VLAPQVAAGLASCADHCDLYVGLGLVRNGEWALAACVLERAVAGLPGGSAVAAEAHAWLGQSLRQLGLNGDAEVHLLAAIDAAPDLPLAWLFLGDLRLASGDLGGAREALLQAQALDPLNPAPCLAIAELKADQGKYDEVHTWIAAAVDRAPTDEAVLKTAARFYLSRNLAPASAIELARAAADAAPGDAEAYMLVGWSHLVQGDAAAALEALNRAVTLSPDLEEAHYLRGRALELSGLPSAARAALRRATDLGYRQP
jgi:tetratricopeptide (TPR) repeat protein